MKYANNIIAEIDYFCTYYLNYVIYKCKKLNLSVALSVFNIANYFFVI